MQIGFVKERTELHSDKPAIFISNQRLSDLYWNYEFFECKSHRNPAQKKRLYYSGKCGDDEKTTISNVLVRRHCHLDDTECSDINCWYNIALRDWLVYENQDILFCFFLSDQRNDCSTNDFTCRQYSDTRNFI